ncbi:PP2C family protein-serine/threonine phosphatase [Slackia heliotrinireducens]|nr:PP2C family serine/threonine-protein phosphatase [Slackia heliotrinireducens]
MMTLRFAYAAFTACGRSHEANEDRALMDGILAGGRLPDESDNRQGTVSQPFLAAVFDGVGGSTCGDAAAQTAAEALELGFSYALKKGQPFDHALDAGIEACRIATSELQETINGTALAAVAGIAFDQDTATVFHAGDVRALRFRSPYAMRLTRDHSLAQQYRDEHGEDAEVPADIAHVITRCLGDERLDQVDVENPVPVLEGDVFLICSDGIWDCVTDEEIEIALAEVAEVISSLNTESEEEADAEAEDAEQAPAPNATKVELALAMALDELVARAYSRNAYDDTTAVALCAVDIQET